jgi:hypothetical protein
MLCSQYKGKVAFGEVRATKNPLWDGAALGLKPDTALPAVVAICNGDLKLRQMYQESMKGEALKHWIGENDNIMYILCFSLTHVFKWLLLLLCLRRI